jgi:putative ABC transport system permease protein
MIIQDLRFALRTLRRTPGFALAAILTLGLGIGATSAVYSVANGILWRPLPVPEPDRLAVLYSYRDDGSGYDDLSWPDYRDLRTEGRAVFTDLIAYSPHPVSLGLPGTTERAWAELVSANYFDVLGRPPIVGRGFVPAEDSAGAAPSAILSDALWRSRFQRDPKVLGQLLRINGREFTIVGVAPEGFQTPFYVGFQPALWLPAGSAWAYLGSPQSALEVRGDATFRMLGRLKPGVDLTQARAAVQGMVARLAQTWPVYKGITGRLFAEREARPEPEAAAQLRLGFGLFLAISLVVLLVACANVASLLLARALARRREIAVRLALGASRGRLVTQLLGESLLLALAGGGLGVVVAVLLSGAMQNLLHFSTDIPFVLDFSLDRRVALFTAGVTLLTTFAFGLVPALQASSPATAGALKSDAAGWRGMHKSRLRASLVVVQLALSCLLLVGAGLVVKSFAAMQRVSPGFETRNGLLVSVSPGLVGYDAARGRRLYRDVLARLRTLPGVQAVTLVQAMPLDFVSSGELIVPEGSAIGTPDKPGETVGWSTIGPDYFTTLGTPLIDGRDFGPGDSVGAPRVAVVSKALAERYWPGQSALGRILRIATPTGEALTVIGVAADAKYRQLSEVPEAHVFVPLGQDFPLDAALVLRTTVEPLSLVPQVRRELAQVDPDLPVSDVKTIEELLAGRAFLMPRIASRVTGALGVLALVLALVGLYGIVSYAVAQRTRELGIRLALGATGSGVVRLVLLEGVKLAAIGIVVGMIGAVIVTRVARSLLFGVSPTDPVVLLLVLASLGGVTVLASWIPARRAARVAPIVALKSE